MCALTKCVRGRIETDVAPTVEPTQRHTDSLGRRPGPRAPAIAEVAKRLARYQAKYCRRLCTGSSSVELNFRSSFSIQLGTKPQLQRSYRRTKPSVKHPRRKDTRHVGAAIDAATLEGKPLLPPELAIFQA